MGGKSRAEIMADYLALLGWSQKEASAALQVSRHALYKWNQQLKAERGEPVDSSNATSPSPTVLELARLHVALQSQGLDVLESCGGARA